MTDIQRTEIEKQIDILEDDIAKIEPTLLGLLLKDKTTKKNIKWCTKDYESYGPEFAEQQEIKVDLITGKFFSVIQPRAAKAKAIQEQRIKNRAEVFTPSWICNEQNNQIDESWFGRKNVFNTPNGTSWDTTTGKISFKKIKDKSWEAYVDARRLEITCGEAPYLVSRYDTTTGKLIPIYERVGLFDRKMRVVNENCSKEDAWLKWSIRAVQSVYGYEFQGDSVLIARENLLYDYIDYYVGRFGETPPIVLLKKIANIIAWNIWQMDGLRCVVPFSCKDVKSTSYQTSLFGDDEDSLHIEQCPGCKNNDLFAHTGIYCKVYDWIGANNSVRFIDAFKK